MSKAASVWTAGANLADVLAEAVLSGFPLSAEHAKSTPLAQWTILVPTRRAARSLDDIVFQRAGKRGLVLPKIRPIGDVDEDDLREMLPDLDVPDAVTKPARLFFLLSLIDQWADENPHIALAQDVARSHSQCVGLADSLGELLDQIETEEVDVTIDEKLFELDLAEHRQAILSLLQLVTLHLPQLLLKHNLMGQAARRNKLIRLEAARIRAGHVKGPIVAVGSTGTNPATRDLLAAIAAHPMGAVILPGLDVDADPATWIAIAPNHPHYAMKMLLEELGVPLSHVQLLRPATPRAQLLAHVMRPAETTAQWHNNAALQALDFTEAMAGVQVIDAADRHLEARAIAVALRQVLETPGKTAALVTPDRDLAQRVTAELRRWHVTIDDSAGQPLTHFGRGQVLDLLMRTVEDNFAAARVVALMAHPQFTLGLEAVAAKRLASLFELVALRRDLPLLHPAHYASDIVLIKSAVTSDRSAHAAVQAMTDRDWEDLVGFAQRLSSAVKDLQSLELAPLTVHVERLAQALDMLAPVSAEPSSVDQVLGDLFESLQQEGAHHPTCTMARAIISVRWCLQRQPVRPVTRVAPRLFIYGLPEARMMAADVIILGGLNETIWPAAADPGPWINRSMRSELGLQQPERDIGITAHDFAQNMDHAHVILSFAQRKGTDPLMVSRWVLRLKAVLQSKGMTLENLALQDAMQAAQTIDHPATNAPHGVPRPKPPVDLRPKHVWVSDIATLKRDPYGLYARKLLRLRPIAKLGADLEPRLRGQLFHDALAGWGKEIMLDANANALDLLISAGKRAFAPFAHETDVKHFWWPRFLRMARAFVTWDKAQAVNVVARLVECSGSVDFMANGVPHILSARADRIDVLRGGRVRIYDYKTGSIPSRPQVKAGFYPQLTLEAAMVLRHGFGRDVPPVVDDIVYVKISGGAKPLEATVFAGQDDFDVIAVADRHFNGLSDMMADYQNPDVPYLPRIAVFKDDDVLDYDHLSRFGEWSLAAT